MHILCFRMLFSSQFRKKDTEKARGRVHTSVSAIASEERVKEDEIGVALENLFRESGPHIQMHINMHYIFD